MKKTLKITGIVAVVLALAAVPFVYAGQRHGQGMAMGMGLGPLGHLGKIQKELDLSDRQVSEIKAIFAALHQENAQYRDQLRGGFDNVISTLLRNPSDIGAAQAIIDQQAQTERALKSNILNAASKALNVLTPEQRDKLGTIISERRARFNRQL